MAGGGVSAVVCVLLFKSSEVSLRAPFVRLGAPLPITPVARRDQLSILLDGQGDEERCPQARTIAEACGEHAIYCVFAPSIIARSINFSGGS